MGKSGSVSCEAIAPFSWILVCTSFVCTLQESVFPFPCNCQLYGEVNSNLPKRAYAIPRSAVLRAPPHVAGRPLVTCTSSGDTQTLKGRSGSFSVGSLGMHKVFLNPLSISCGKRFHSKRHFVPLTIFWGFFALGHVVSFFGGIQHSAVDRALVQQLFVILEFSLAGEDKHTSFYSVIL